MQDTSQACEQWCNLNQAEDYISRESNPGFHGHWPVELPLRREGLYQTFDTSHHGVAVNLPTDDRETPGSTPGKYNLQIKITSNNNGVAEKKTVCT